MPIATVELAEHNRRRAFGDTRTALPWVIQKIYLPVNQRRNGTMQSNEHFVGHVTQTLLTIGYTTIMVSEIQALLTMACNGNIMRIMQDSSFMDNNVGLEIYLTSNFTY